MKKKKLENQLYLKMWVAFVDISAQNGYQFDNLIDGEGHTNIPVSAGAIAYIVVKSEDILDAITTVQAGLLEKHFYLKEILRIDNLDTLVKNKTARKIDIKTANWLERTDYIFKISGRIWPYSSCQSGEDDSSYSNLWLVHARKNKFEYINRGKDNGKIEIEENWVYAIVKCNSIKDCQHIFNLNSRNENITINFIDSIVNFNEYIDANNSIDNKTLADAVYLKNSETNFIYTTVTSDFDNQALSEHQ